MSVLKKNYLLEMRLRIKKFKLLSDFKTKFLQRVRFQIRFFTTREILKQKFHNMSDFKSKILQRVRFFFETFCKKSDFARKCAFKKSRFD